MTTSYMVTLTEDGKGEWLHPAGGGFVFAYVDSSWAADLKLEVAAAYKQALTMPSAIKDAVKETTGEDAIKGLYLLDQAGMTAAMNSIDGMGETAVEQKGDSGEGTAVTINQQFFSAVLAGMSGDIAPLMSYLTGEMGDLQAQTRSSKVTANFGTIIGTISVVPELDVVVSEFKYVFSSSETANWFVKVNCGTAEHYSYDYSYAVVNYNYSKPGPA